MQSLELTLEGGDGMGLTTGDNYNPALIPAFMNFKLMNQGREAELDRLLQGKDEINKQTVMRHLDQFSCKEEMERFVENLEEK